MHMEVRIWNDKKMKGVPTILHGPPKRVIRRTIAFLFDSRVEEIMKNVFEMNGGEE